MKKLLYVLLTCFFGSVVMAQEKQVLTFDEAMKLGIKSNVGLRQAQNLLLISKANQTFTNLDRLPSINARGSAFQDKGNQFYQVEDQIVAINTTTNKIRGSISAQMTLVNGMNKQSAHKQNVHMTESQTYSMQRSKQDAISDISSGYLQCLLDKKLLKIAKENFEAQKKNYAQIMAFVEAGRRAPVDGYTQEAEMKRLELEVIRAQNTLVNDLAGLALLLQVDTDVYGDISDPEWDILEIMNETLDIEEMKITALSNRADLKSLRYAENASKMGVRLARSQYYPNLVAFYDLSTNYTEANVRSFDQQFMGDNVFHSYGLSLSVPIFNGLSARTGVARAKSLMDNASINRENLEYAINSEIIQAYQDFNDVQLSYKVSESQFIAAEKAEEYERGRYQNGVTNLIDYTNANRAKIVAQNNFAQAKYRMIFQKIKLEYTLGTLQYSTDEE